MFKIYGDRPELWQWDTGQKIIVENEKISEVHFCNGINSQALVCQVYDLDGLRVVNIPNIALQDNCDMNIYAFVANEDGSYTEHREKIKINKRSKPADYVYTETELKSYETLEKQIVDVNQKVDNMGGGLTETEIKHLISEETPTKTSQLENDSDFVNKKYVDDILGAINAELASLTEVE